MDDGKLRLGTNGSAAGGSNPPRAHSSGVHISLSGPTADNSAAPGVPAGAPDPSEAPAAPNAATPAVVSDPAIADGGPTTDDAAAPGAVPDTFISFNSADSADVTPFQSPIVTYPSLDLDSDAASGMDQNLGSEPDTSLDSTSNSNSGANLDAVSNNDSNANPGSVSDYGSAPAVESAPIQDSTQTAVPTRIPAPPLPPITTAPTTVQDSTLTQTEPVQTSDSTMSQPPVAETLVPDQPPVQTSTLSPDPTPSATPPSPSAPAEFNQVDSALAEPDQMGVSAANLSQAGSASMEPDTMPPDPMDPNPAPDTSYEQQFLRSLSNPTTDSTSNSGDIVLPSDPTPSRSRRGLFVGLAIGAVAILVIILVVLLVNNPQSGSNVAAGGDDGGSSAGSGDGDGGGSGNSDGSDGPGNSSNLADSGGLDFVPADADPKAIFYSYANKLLYDIESSDPIIEELDTYDYAYQETLFGDDGLDLTYFNQLYQTYNAFYAQLQAVQQTVANPEALYSLATDYKELLDFIRVNPFSADFSDEHLVEIYVNSGLDAAKTAAEEALNRLPSKPIDAATGEQPGDYNVYSANFYKTKEQDFRYVLDYLNRVQAAGCSLDDADCLATKVSDSTEDGGSLRELMQEYYEDSEHRLSRFYDDVGSECYSISLLLAGGRQA